MQNSTSEFFMKKILIVIKSYLNPRRYLWMLYKKKYEDNPFIYKMKGGIKIRLHTTDIIGQAIIENGAFEPSEIAFVTNYLRPGMVFIDIGANIGLYTLFASKCVGANGTIYSFEPNERMFTELTYNVSLNSFSDICTLNNYAISDFSGVSKLSKYEEGAEVFGSLGNQHWAEAKIIGYDDVETVRLDDYLNALGIIHVDLIKMDIEGAELLALKGCKELLSKSTDLVIILEVAEENTRGFGYSTVEIFDFLNSLGYSMYSLKKNGELFERVNRDCCINHAQNLVAMKNAKWKI